MRIIITLLCLITLSPSSVWAFTALPEDKSAAVILTYQRINEDAQPESSLRLEQFKEHIEEIMGGGYNVLPLPDLITALKSAEPLPPRTIAITFDGGFRSAYDHAFPLLLENGIPFTVFYAENLTENPNYINHKEIRSLAKKNSVTMGILPANYDHIAHIESTEALRQINTARSAFTKHIGHEARYFAYPYGETSTDLQSTIKLQNFDAAFGLHSGAIFAGADFTALPRFTMTDSYGDIDRFRLITNALPFPATDIEPANNLLSSENAAIGFTAPEALKDDLNALSCFISGQEKPDIEILGNRAEIRPKEPLTAERIRINCTLPAPKDENDRPRWRWLGMLLHSAQ